MIWRLIKAELVARWESPWCRWPLIIAFVCAGCSVMMLAGVAGLSVLPAWMKLAIVGTGTLSLCVAALKWLVMWEQHLHESHCKTCGYDLCGHEADLDCCPECGLHPQQESASFARIRLLIDLVGIISLYVGVIMTMLWMVVAAAYLSST